MKNRSRLLNVMLSFAFLLSSCGGNETTWSQAPELVPDESVPQVELSEPASELTSEPESAEFVPVFRLLACSDTHISTTYDESAKRLAKLFASAYKYADAHPDYNGVDAMIVAGDLTNHGDKSELDAWNSVVNGNIRESTALITVMGNHEFYSGGIPAYTEKRDGELDKHVVVNGYHLIGLSTRGDDNYTAEQLEWLGDRLREAVADDPEKPVFTFQHHHLQNTVYVSKTWYTSASSRLKEIYSEYPQVINLSGHSHGPINNPLSVWQGGFTALGTGTLAYFEMESGMTEPTIPSDAGTAAQYYIIEVAENGCVHILPYNIITDSFFKTPSNTDGKDEQLVYTVKKPSDPSTFLYTDSRKDEASPPRFADGTAVSVSNITYSGATVSFPVALDDGCIYGYRIVCTSPDGKTAEFRSYAKYYIEPMPSVHQMVLGGLKDGTEYTAKLYPQNVWDKFGEPITFTFTTKKREEISYTSKNPVTYYGTFTDFESLTELKRSTGCNAFGGKINGDVFGGDWSGGGSDDNVALSLAKGKGENGSTALAVSYNGSSHINRGIYIYATDDNRNTTDFPTFGYLRLWVDFTNVDFRKACFGLVTQDGRLYSTDDIDYASDSPFYFLKSGSDQWKEYQHGGDGCFGVAEGASVKGFCGYLVFPVEMFGSRSCDGTVFDGQSVSAVYMYFDLNDDSMLGKEFYLDEIHLVDDYTAFDIIEK